MYLKKNQVRGWSYLEKTTSKAITQGESDAARYRVGYRRVDCSTGIIDLRWSQTGIAQRWRKEKLTIKKRFFFTSDRWAERYRDGQAVDSSMVVWEADSFKDSASRPDGYTRRFPFLRGRLNQPGIFTAGVIAGMRRTDSGPARGMLRDSVLATLRRKLQEDVDALRHVDIVFVVDATRSVTPYFEAVANAISGAVRDLSAEQHVKHRFGVVTYTDYGGPMSMLGLTGQESVNRVVQFLGQINPGREVDSSHPDTSLPEAVFDGLIRGLRRMDLERDHTNLIIWVGDAGNHRNDARTSIGTVIDQLVKQECHFLAFQVHHASVHQTYRDFINQGKDIIEKTGRRFCAELSVPGTTAVAQMINLGLALRLSLC